MKRLKKILIRLFWLTGAATLMQKLANRYLIRKCRAGSLVLPLLRTRASRTVQILVYHRVNDEGDPFFPATSIADFRRQMAFIAENYRVYSLEDATESIQTDEIPEDAIVITFDDGYRDNFQNAFPILREFSIPATVFLATDAVRPGKRLWHDDVFSAFRNTKALWLKGLPDKRSVFSLQTLADKLQAQRHILQLLWSLTVDERENRVEQLLDSLNVKRCDDQTLMLSWEEIQVMHAHGICFGSHTVTHPILSTLPEARLLLEIIESKRVIEEQLTNRISTFAYPVGRAQDFDARTKAILKEHGYRSAVTTIFGVNEPGDDLFALRRMTPWERDLPSFATKLAWYRFAASR